MTALVIAIDGPSGSGKSTVARGVASALGLEVLDTGAMYRAVTLAAMEADIALDDADACAALARRLTITVEHGVTQIDGRDVSAEIRGPAVTGAVSIVAANPAVRSHLVARQRAWVERHGGGVVEGRDIGTVVFPDAPVKVFLTAESAARAGRRAAEANWSAVSTRHDQDRRDRLDAPQSGQAADAVEIDSTRLDLDQVVEVIVRLAREYAGQPHPRRPTR